MGLCWVCVMMKLPGELCLCEWAVLAEAVLCTSLIFLLLWRKEWEDLSGKLGAAFKLDEHLSKQDDTMMRRARDLYDELFAREAYMAKGKGYGKSDAKGGGKGDKNRKGTKRSASVDHAPNPKAQLKCFKCGKTGHLASQCWSKVKSENLAAAAVAKTE